MAGGIISNLMYAVGFKIQASALGDAEKKVGKLTKSVFGLGVAAASIATGIGIAGMAAASNFETAMSKVQGTTGMAAEQMEETRSIAKNLYSQNFGENWQDLGSSISSVAQITKQTGADLESTTRNALLLRDTFGIEVPESARAAKTMVENFGISSEQAFNLMAQGTQKGLDFSGELMDTINEYSLQFKSLGFSANDMFDTLAAGAAEGAFNLDKVADAVKEFNIRAKDGSATTIQGFEMLGLNAKEMMHTFAAGGPAAKAAFTQITQMIGDIADPVAQNTVAVNLFGTQFEDLQKDVITAMGTVRSQFDMTKDTMGELNQVKFNSPGQAFAMFRRQLETGILIPIGEKVLPYLNRFGQWMSDHRPRIEAIGNAIGDKLGAGIDAIASGFRIAMPYVQKFGSWLVNPLGSGIAGATSKVQTMMPTLRELGGTAKDVFENIVTAAGNVWDKIEPVATLVGGALLDGFQTIVPWVASFAEKAGEFASRLTAWEGFTPVIIGIAGALVTLKAAVLADTAAKKINKLWTDRSVIANRMLGRSSMVTGAKLIKSWAMASASAIASGAVYVAQAAVIVGRWVWMGFQSMIQAARMAAAWVIALGPIGWITAAVIGIAALVIANWDKIKAWTVKVWKSISAWLSQTWDKIRTGVATAFGKITGFFKRWGSIILSVVLGPIGYLVGQVVRHWDTLKTKTIRIFTAIWDGIKRGFDAVVGFIKRWGSLILAVITGPIGLIVNTVIKNWDRIKFATVTAFTAIWNWLKGIWSSITSTVSEAGSRMTGMVTKAWGRLRGSISHAMEGVKTTMSNSWDSIVGAVTGVGDRIKGTFVGIWDGVKSTFVGAINWIIDKFNNMIDTLNSSLSISLPDWMGGKEFSVSIPTISPIDGSHSDGLAKVPWDGYIAELHKGERVLTAEENKRYSPESDRPARYTPETAPARTTNSAPLRLQIDFNFSGSAPAMPASKEDEGRLQRMMEETFMSALRRLGLEDAYGNA